MVHNTNTNDGTKLVYLQEAMRTPALKALLQPLGGDEGGYVAALGLLRERYDKPFELRQLRLAKFEALPCPADNYDSLDLFSHTIDGLFCMFKADAQYSEVDVVMKAVDKLPRAPQREYRQQARNVFTYENFQMWLKGYVDASRPFLGVKAVQKSGGIDVKAASKASGGKDGFRAHAASLESSPCVVCGAKHLLRKCAEFKRLSVPQRWDAIRGQKLCLVCLEPGAHRKEECPLKDDKGVTCGGACKFLHNRSLCSELPASGGQGEGVRGGGRGRGGRGRGQQRGVEDLASPTTGRTMATVGGAHRENHKTKWRFAPDGDLAEALVQAPTSHRFRLVRQSQRQLQQDLVSWWVMPARSATESL